MKIYNVFYLFLFLFLIFSCASDKDHEFTFENGTIQVLDSVLIDDSGFSFINVWNPKIFNDSILGFGDGSFSSINLFHAKTGAFINTFEMDSLDSFIIPKKSYANFTIYADKIYLLNNMLNKIYVFNLNKEFIEVIDLKFEKELLKSSSVGLFQVINNDYFVSTEYSTNRNDTFKNSPLISHFDKQGQYLNSFGSYPKSYTEGNLVLSTNENKIVKDEKIYVLNVAGVPILKEYSLSGNLIGLFKLSSNHFDPKIGFFTNDPFTGPLTDQFDGLATDENKSEKIFYAAYHSFDTRDREYGLKTYRYMLMKIDLERMTIKETQLAGFWHLNEMSNLLPQVYGDTVSVLIREQNENLYLKRLIFD